MSATELSLLGQLPSELHAALVKRLSAQAQSASQYYQTEMVYGRAAPGSPDENVLRIRSLRTSKGITPEWSIVVVQRPEPARLSPHILQRGCTECVVQDGCHPASLASALGFSVHSFSVHQHGVRFQQGAVIIDVYQLCESDGTDLPIDRSSYNVSVSTRLLAQPRPTANHPTSTSAQELRAAASAAVHQVAAQLKGIVDLTRIE